MFIPQMIHSETFFIVSEGAKKINDECGKTIVPGKL
jgi:hypothetical protein